MSDFVQKVGNGYRLTANADAPLAEMRPLPPRAYISPKCSNAVTTPSLAQVSLT